MSRSKSKKAFCNIPSHKFSSLDYSCNTCNDSICSTCIKQHSGHHITTRKLPDVNSKISCEKSSSYRSTFCSSKGSPALHDKAGNAQCAVSGEQLKNEQKEHLSEQYSQTDNEEIHLRNETKRELKMKHKTIKQMYFGYREMKKGDTILVIILSANDDNIPDHYNGFQIYKRSESDISKEAEDVMYAVGSKGDYSITSDKLKEIKQAIAQNIEKLLSDHSNITIINYCPIKSSRAGKHFKYRDEMCIVIYCRIKGIIPIEEEPFPTEINGFSVDVREGYASFTGMHNDDLPRSHDRQTPLRLGGKIGARGQMGTLGIFVDFGDREKGFITCGHLVLKKEELNHHVYIDHDPYNPIAVFQPSHEIDQNKIGYVKKAIFHCNDRLKTSIDAALVKITEDDRYPIDGFMVKSGDEILRFTGFSSETPPCFDSGAINCYPSPGCRVIKVGAATGITAGMLVAEGIYARIENLHMTCYGAPQTRFEMYNQYEVYALDQHELFRLGDSGAAVLEGLGQNLTLVGMAIGVTSYKSAIVTPIKKIFDELGLGIRVGQFRQTAKSKKRKYEYQNQADFTDLNSSKICGEPEFSNFAYDKDISEQNQRPDNLYSENTAAGSYQSDYKLPKPLRSPTNDQILDQLGELINRIDLLRIDSEKQESASLPYTPVLKTAKATLKTENLTVCTIRTRHGTEIHASEHARVQIHDNGEMKIGNFD